MSLIACLDDTSEAIHSVLFGIKDLQYFGCAHEVEYFANIRFHAEDLEISFASAHLLSHSYYRSYSGTVDIIHFLQIQNELIMTGIC